MARPSQTLTSFLGSAAATLSLCQGQTSLFDDGLVLALAVSQSQRGALHPLRQVHFRSLLAIPELGGSKCLRSTYEMFLDTYYVRMVWCLQTRIMNEATTVATILMSKM